MRLAADPITIEIAGEAYELHPSLRAATRLARRHGDFASIYKAILADHVSVVVDVIAEGSNSKQVAGDFLIECEIHGLRARLAALKLPLLRFTLALAGHDEDEPDDPAAAGKPIPFADFHTQLFRIGTGWLGWSPADTWDATPAEILAAHQGRSEMIGTMLKALVGTSDAPKPSYDPDATFDRAGFERLRAMSGKAYG